MLHCRPMTSIDTATDSNTETMVRCQGIEPEVRTFNTVIIACNMSGQAAEALKVYERMLNAGAQPTATTYTALIRCGVLQTNLSAVSVCPCAHICASSEKLNCF